MPRTSDNEYQHPTSSGSLVGARTCWQTLRAAGQDAVPQQFEFTFACPTLPIAHGLAALLRDSMVWVSPVSFPAAHPAATQNHPFQLDGLTHLHVQSLEQLEHMFTSFRRMGQRHRSQLVELRLVHAGPDTSTPQPGC